MLNEKYIIHSEEIPWSQPPEHYDAFSKFLINKDTCGSKHFDFRVSIYQPRGYAAEHSHQNSEQIYYIISGTGLVTLGDEKFVVKPNDAIFIPIGIRHSISNSGFEDLVFVLATTPPEA